LIKSETSVKQNSAKYESLKLESPMRKPEDELP